MATWAEVSSWSSPELAVEVRNLLPDDWTFEHHIEDGAFTGSIVDVNNAPVWNDVQADERLLLLNAYGWLFTRKPTRRNPIWIRGQIDVPIAIQALPTVTQKDGPEDLDPAEVESVYRDPK